MKFTALLLSILMQFVFIVPPKVFAATTTVDLLTAKNYVVLAGASIVDTNPPSTVTGDVGLSPASGSFIGISCAEVTGSIFAVDAAGPAPCSSSNAGALTIAKNDLTTAYNNTAARSTTQTIGTELAGSTLTDGVYASGSTTFEIASAGTLTLDGGGNADSVFIFKMCTTLTTFSNSRVVLTNGAQACNVFWQVGSSATLGTGTSFVGTVMADQSITDNGSSTVAGRFLARIATVTLNHTTIARPTCASSGSSSSSSSSSLNSTSSPGAATIVCPILNYVTPLIIESRRVSPTSISFSWGPYSGINTFSVEYGLTNGNWVYSTTVTGFSTTLNSLPANQPIWVRIASTDGCSVGTYGSAQLIGGPSLPNTGFEPRACFSD